MDEMLGYPTEYQRHRIRVALNDLQLQRMLRSKTIAEHSGFTAKPLDRKELQELVPFVGDNAVGGLFLDFGGHANPQRTSQAYAWALQDHGGRIVQNATVRGIKTSGGKATEIETDRGTFGFDQLVIAAGPQTGMLAAMIGAELPLAPARVEIIVTEPLPLIRYGGTDGNGLYGRQTLRGNLAYGGGPHEWIDLDGMQTPPRVTTSLVRHLARRLAELFPKAAHARVIRSWGGIVENTPDGRPVIDRLADPGNVILATMSSVGFGLSPASGRAIMEMVMHGSCRFADTKTLGLARFKGLEPDWRRTKGWVPVMGQEDRAPAA
jgi:sarcosine oxidase subunit beta